MSYNFKIKDFEVKFEFLNYCYYTFVSSKMYIKSEYGECIFICNIMIENNEDSNLFINYKESIYSSDKDKKNYDKDILINRFIDKCIRPFYKIKKSISININCIKNTFNYIDIHLFASYIAILTIKKIFPISLFVYRIYDNNINLLIGYDIKNIFAIEMSSNGKKSSELINLIKDFPPEMQIFIDILENIKSEFKNPEIIIEKINDKFNLYSKESVNYYLVENKKRIDNRNLDEIRTLSINNNYSENMCTFGRGETVVLGIINILNNDSDNVKIYSNYFFNNFAVGELNKRNNLSRREIGHAELIRKSFLYTINISFKTIVEVLSSNGSSSMAGVCVTSLILYKMGLISEDDIITGISIGVFSNNKSEIIVSDLTAEEDYFSNCDFKISSKKDNIIAIQLDCNKGIKISSLNKIFKLAIQKNNEIKDFIIKNINKNEKQNKYIQIKKEKLGALIGSNGNHLKLFTKNTNCFIKINQNGLLLISGKNIEYAQYLINFYCLENLKPKDKVLFFIKKVENKEIETTIGKVILNKKYEYKKDDCILGLVKDWSKLSIKLLSINNIFIDK